MLELERRLEAESEALKRERMEKEKLVTWVWSLENQSGGKEMDEFLSDRAASLSESEAQKQAFEEAVAASEQRIEALLKVHMEQERSAFELERSYL